MEAIPSREVAILFADVSGSTRLYEGLGDAEARRVVGSCLDVIRQSSEAHAGRLLKTIGDGALVVFPYAGNAAYAAIDMQNRVALMRAPDGRSLAIRVGFHFGPAIGDADDIHGDAVNLASRLSDLAKAGETLLSADTAERLPASLRARTRSLDAHTVKGKAADIRVVELVGQESDAELTTLAARPTITRAFLRLQHRGGELLLDGTVALLKIGRETGSDLQIAGSGASRRHARIERRRDKFVLIDESTNGTWCTIAGDDEILLRREEIVLRRQGTLSFGQPYRDDPSAAVRFSCID